MRYEKGHKDASRRRIVEVAAKRFRNDGIAASGIAGIMTEAGLTNGAFYPHFQSKAELVAECVVSALQDQAGQTRQALAAGGIETLLDVYLSADHRDNPSEGCASAALLPELARQPQDMRALYSGYFQALVDQLAQALPRETADPAGMAIGICATLMGALQLARAAADPQVSDRILEAGKAGIRAMIAAGRTSS